MQRAKVWLYRGAQAGALALTTGVGALGLAQHPFAAPLVERSIDDTARELERAFKATFTPGWVEGALAQALAAGDQARALWLADLALAEGVALNPEQAQQIAALRAQQEGLLAGAIDCALCAWDIRSCRSLPQIAACAIPVELTPLGDANALRRQALAALHGAEVDRLETGLALVGLGATALVVLTGGSSAALKAGASGLRVARRMGSVSPDLGRVLADAADLPVNWTAALRNAPLDEITDAAKLARLGNIARDLGKVAANTAPADALILLRHVDSADDAARLARLSDAARARTLSRVEVLGKARAFRAMVRVSDVALATLAALYAAAVQILLMLSGGLVRAVLRLARP
ncbi:MAG: hypothetical protein ACK4S2_10130 [Gemmobacter sp.]|uniref:hypothetical protein n=1 Tax=Gemmobacter sp. TaxID=1898957 RepID=UPI00391B45B1